MQPQLMDIYLGVKTDGGKKLMEMMDVKIFNLKMKVCSRVVTILENIVKVITLKSRQSKKSINELVISKGQFLSITLQ